MGVSWCRMDGKPQDNDELRPSDSGARGCEGEAKAAQPAPPPQPASWDPTDVRGCDAELLVIAAIQAFVPTGLKRYLQRKAKVTGFRCFEYEPHDDGGFRIGVPSHALTIDTELKDHWKSMLKEKDICESKAVLIKVIGRNALAQVFAGDGDKSKLRMVEVVEVEDD
mmetsp:Transcript_118185/g.294835  ORF Transcript_118185/g.294835 Transcript_118185/m.294835 type:complete len:167 (-) Transcript_118185:151-651(-)